MIRRVEERLSALGNVIACNDYVALAHPDLDRVICASYNICLHCLYCLQDGSRLFLNFTVNDVYKSCPSFVILILHTTAESGQAGRIFSCQVVWPCVMRMMKTVRYHAMNFIDWQLALKQISLQHKNLT